MPSNENIMSDAPLPLQPLDDDALNRLAEHLAAVTGVEDEHDLTTDVMAAHGFMIAEALQPSPLGPTELLPALLEETDDIPAAQQAALSDVLLQLAERARQAFYLGHSIELPFDLSWEADSEADIGDWSAGFMQAVFHDEARWFGSDSPQENGQQETAHEPRAQQVAELLLPIMALSGLFEDEEELAEVSDDPDLLNQFTEQLPELLVDLFCQLNAPEDKPSPAKTSGKGPGKGQRRSGQRQKRK